jgi:uncharacterized protein
MRNRVAQVSDVTVEVIDNGAEHRYEARVDGDLAGSAYYRDDGTRRVFTHTKVDDDYEGIGVGSALARAALEDARRRELAVVPRCPFIAGYIQRHPQFADLVQR